MQNNSSFCPSLIPYCADPQFISSNFIINMILKDLSLVPGLCYLPNFISQHQKTALLSIIAHNSWCNQLKRKQQYYGIKYFQTKLPDHVLQPTVSIDHQPLDPFKFIIDKCISHGFFSTHNPPNQLLVNRYVHNDRLGLHVEDVNAFGEVIVGISIGSKDYLRLARVEDMKEYKLELEDCSCYVLQG